MNLKRIALLLVPALVLTFALVSYHNSASAAIPSLAVWEVRPATGNDNNGGCFIPGSSGTDWSQQNSPQYALTGVTSSGAGNTVLSASAAADMVGNCTHVISGTNFNTGFFEVQSVVVGVSITFSTNLTGQSITSGVGAAGVLNIGGAIAKLTTGLNQYSTGSPSSPCGPTFWFTGTDTETTSWNPSTGCGAANGTPFAVIGYGSSRGDGVRATWTTATNSTPLIILGNNSPTGFLFENISFTNTAGTSSNVLNTTSGSLVHGIMFQNCKMSGFTTAIDATANQGVEQLWLQKVEITASSSHALNLVTSAWVLDSYIHDNTGNGMLVSGAAQTGMFVVKNSVFYKNLNHIYNQNTQGLNAVSHPVFTLINNDFSDATNDGFKNDASTQNVGWVYNNIWYNNANLDIEYVNNPPIFSVSLNNAMSGSVSHWPGGIQVVLTADPFNGRTTGDFTLNNAAGGGALCKSSGFPGNTGLYGTGFATIGALQPSAGASSSSIGASTMH